MICESNLLYCQGEYGGMGLTPIEDATSRDQKWVERRQAFALLWNNIGLIILQYIIAQHNNTHMMKNISKATNWLSV